MRSLRLILGSLFLVLATTFGLAQTGSVQGTVTDSVGAVVQGAEITVKNLGSNAVRTVTSSGTGAYSVPSLPPGVYDITVKMASFKSFHISDVPLSVAQVLPLNVQLEPGAVTEEVQVRADQIPDVDLETSQVSNLVDERAIKDLPLITRDPYSLVLLSPGTSQTNSRLGGFTVNGSRERNNNFLLDGVDNNDTSVPGAAGGVLSANPDSTQEFRVITNNFNAEFGRNTGAIIDVVTKGGTNSFHGNAYEFGRWNGFGGARDWFNRVSDGPQDPYVRNQFGYSIGGPIRKDKTFFFFNHELQRFVTTLTGTANVPTAAFKTGVFNYTFIDPDTLGSTTVPVDLGPSSSNNVYGLPLDPTAQQVLALYPNAPQSADGVSGTIHYPSSSRTSGYQTVAKIDHHFTDRETLSLRYGYDHSFDPNPFHDDILPGNVAATSSKAINQGLSANLVSSLTSNLLNNFTFGWNRVSVGFKCTGLGVLDSVSPLDQFGNGRDYNMDPFTSFGCLSLVSDGQFRATGTTSYSDSINWVHGSHTFKFGGDFRNVHESGPNSFFSRRQVDLNTFVIFGDPFSIGFNLIDVPGVTDRANTGITLSDAASALYGFVAEDLNGEFFNKAGVRLPTDNKLFRQHEYDWFGQDTWKLRRNLTLTLGLRYQLDGVPYEENANMSNLLSDPATTFPVVLSIVGPGTGNQLYKTDYSNIEPRVGFSWDPRGDGKMAVRGAFGIFHDRVFGNLFGNARGNPPFEQDYSFFPFETINDGFGSGLFPAVTPTTTPSTTIPDYDPNTGVGALAPVIFDTHFRNPVSNNWNFGIQRELPGDTTLDLAYVGSKGTHIYRAIDGNPPDPNLVNQLVAFCSDPSNAFDCTPATVSGTNLYIGAQQGVLPFNAVAHNALLQPPYTRAVGNSVYHSLQLKVTRRLSHGFQLQGSYTWAHGIDDSPDPIDPALGNRTFPRNSRDLAQDRGNSDNDVRHVGVINYIWEVPLGRGKAYMNNGLMGRIFEGMQFSGITTMQTGHPFEVRGRRDSQRTGIASWADQVGDPFAPGDNNDPAVNGGNKVFFSNPGAFQNPPFGRAGSVGRNQFYGPNFVNFDLAFTKQIRITEKFRAELRAEGFNILNHPNFSNPDSLGNQIGNFGAFGLLNATVGRPDATTSARQMQVALKLSF
ncbi:MAG TPA: carboxypeptidase-like regulatory domain-containing protein [Terriglobales bacterium]|nr:carboxypeptidase-like regulatory domain-containing protein [Terriglobales bacterium]